MGNMVLNRFGNGITAISTTPRYRPVRYLIQLGGLDLAAPFQAGLIITASFN